MYDLSFNSDNFVQEIYGKNQHLTKT